jgi:hypothetical protein
MHDTTSTKNSGHTKDSVQVSHAPICGLRSNIFLAIVVFNNNGCWCMYWRVGGTYRGRREKNKRTLRNIVGARQYAKTTSGSILPGYEIL